jgi:hypothetical protein
LHGLKFQQHENQVMEKQQRVHTFRETATNASLSIKKFWFFSLPLVALRCEPKQQPISTPYFMRQLSITAFKLGPLGWL